MGLNGISIGIIVIFIGIYGVLTKKNIIKKVMSLYIMNSGVILLFVSLGYVSGGLAAIIEDSSFLIERRNVLVVDPLPQAIMLTAIVIGLGITALALALAIKVYEQCKTLNVTKLVDK